MNLFKLDLEISRTKILTLTLLLVLSLSWFFLMQAYLVQILNRDLGNSFWFFGGASGANIPMNPGFWSNVGVMIFYAFSAISAIVGSMIHEKVKRSKLLAFSIVFGGLVTLSLIWVQGIVFSIISCGILGFTFGLGLPGSLALLGELTSIEERGRISGLVVFGSLMIVFLAGGTVTVLNLSLETIIFLMAALRFSSSLALFSGNCNPEIGKQKKWLSVLTYKPLVYYVIPYSIFVLTTGLMSWAPFPSSVQYDYAREIGSLLFFTFAAIFGLVSGFIVDLFGRKKPIVAGLVLMGISFTILSVSISPMVLILYEIISGVTWGLLATIYFTIPGDLSQEKVFIFTRERFYAIGLIVPLILIAFFGAVPELGLISLQPGAISPFLTMIIFASILPLLRVKETLPEALFSKREIQKHIEKVGKEIEKERNIG